MTATTSKQRFNARFGRTLVPENYLLPILRDHKITRFGEPGYVWVNPWDEEKLPLIYTGYRRAEFNVVALSGNAHEFTIEGGLAYFFDPRKANDQVALQLAKAVSESDQPLKNILREAVGPAIRDFVSQQPSLALAEGKTRLEIEAHVRSRLKSALRPYGIQLAEIVENGQPIGVKGINLRIIHLPAWLTNFVDMSHFVTNAAAAFNMPAHVMATLLMEQKNIEQASVNGNLVYMASSVGTQGNALVQAVQQWQNQIHTNGATKAGDPLHRRLSSRSLYSNE